MRDEKEAFGSDSKCLFAKLKKTHKTYVSPPNGGGQKKRFGV